MWRDPEVLTPRRVLALADETIRCEPHSALRRHIAPESFGWSRETSVLADIFDRYTIFTLAVAGVKDDDPPLYPRPGFEPKKKKKEPKTTVLSMTALVQISQSSVPEVIDAVIDN